MWNDPIVEEVRRERDRYAAALGYDLKAIFSDLREQQEQARRDGWEVVSLPRRTVGEPANASD